MTNKKVLMLIGIIVSMISVTACKNNQKEISELEKIPITDNENFEIGNFPTYITEESESNSRKLSIDAYVEAGNLSGVAEYRLMIDQDKANAMVHDLVYTKYPNAVIDDTQPEGRNWNYRENDRVYVSFTVSDAGYVNYQDYKNDISTSMVDGEHLFEYGYITERVPSNMLIASEEAIKIAREFCESYSDLSFDAFNVTAANNADPTASGCYYIMMQAVYDGIPISTKYEGNGEGIKVLVLLSNAGIFAASGKIPLMPSKSKDIAAIVSLDTLVEKVQTEFALWSVGDAVKINRIALEYFPITNADETITLRPVWSFYCIDTKEETQGTVISNYVVSYFAEDGSFCGLYH